ncbi:MAG: serine/threonine-protein kinase [Bacteroidota bacterium]
MSFSYPTIGATIPGSDELGQLVLERVLGAGAFGIVFQAKAAKTGATVAVKFLQAGVLATPHERQALFNEVLAAREIQHPHVLRILFASTDSDNHPPYVGMEFADAGTLQQRIDEARRAKTPIPLEVVAEWSLNLVSAMHAINAHLLHRDLKPDNILFCGDTIKVADFGLAKLVDASTRTVTFKGGQHVLYMAPEAWEGQRNEIQLDMYALGVVLFQIATLEFPYQVPAGGGELEAFRRMHIFQPPKVARTVRPEVPQRYSEVIQRLLSKRPGDRYRSWDEVRSALESAFVRDRSGELNKPAALASLVEEANRRHREATERRLADEALRRKRGEQQEIDRLQQDEIVERFRALIQAFNTETEGPKACLEASAGGAYQVRLPYAQVASLSFFPIEPPLSLPPHQVRFGALVADPNGCGFNLLLKRHPDEQYGEWSVCRVRANPISGRVHRHCDYFGFGPSKIVEIERGHRAVHIYVPEFSNDVDGAIEAFLRSLYGGRR